MHPDQQLLATISSLLTPVLFGIVAFFVRSLMTRFQVLEAEVKEFLIRNARFEQQVVELEEKVRALNQIVLNLLAKHS